MSGRSRVPDSLATTGLTAEQCRRAARTVARNAQDAADLAELLDMLGLSAAQARPRSAAEPAAPQPSKPLRRIHEFAVELDELHKAEAATHVRRHHQPAASR